MQEKDVAAVLKNLKFLPTSLLQLILTNINGAFDISSFTEVAINDVERTVNGQNKLLSCNIVLLINYAEGKPVKLKFAMKFRDDALRSFSWGI